MFVAAEQLPYYAEVLHKERPFGELEQRILGFLSEVRTHKQMKRSLRLNRPNCSAHCAIWSLFPDRAPKLFPRVI